MKRELGVEPPALRDRPKLDFRQVYYYNAFQAMSSSRTAGMSGAMPIPLTEIVAYCNLFYIAQLEEREQLLRYVSSMDRVYLEFAAKQAKSNSPK